MEFIPTDDFVQFKSPGIANGVSAGTDDHGTTSMQRALSPLLAGLCGRVA